MKIVLMYNYFIMCDLFPKMNKSLNNKLGKSPYRHKRHICLASSEASL